MKRLLPLVLTVLAAGCGGAILDVGGDDPSDGSPDGSVPGVDAGSWPVPLQRNARSLRSDGPYLYWIADQGDVSEIRRCEKSACGQTTATLMKIPTSNALATIEIRGDTIYAVDKLRILSCPLGGCSTPQVIVTNVKVEAAAFDDSKVYWSQREVVSGKLRSTIFTCPITGCTQSTPFLSADANELAVDETSLYWIADDEYLQVPSAVMSAPKDGSAAATIFAPQQNQAASLVLRGGFVYWATSFTLGTVVRCPIAGCPSDGPEVLIDRQYFPQFVNPGEDFLVWMNGPSSPDAEPSTVGHPVQILGCQLTNCAAATELFDEGRGGGFGLRSRSLPPSEMVVDAEAIYWIGDVVNAAPSPPWWTAVDASNPAHGATTMKGGAPSMRSRLL